MKILYVHQYFKTPEEGGAVRSYHIAKGMVDAGHSVELITSHNKRGYQKVMIEGITVHYLPISYSNSMNSFSRVRSFYKFVSMATGVAQKIEAIDLCYATSTPLTVAYVALKLKEKLGIPFVFEVRDLWPDAPIELGVIKYKFLKDYFYSLEKKVYKEANTIIALSPDIKKSIESKIDNHNKVAMIPNFSDCEFFEPSIKHPYLERKYGCIENITISYLGAIGKANHLEYLLNIAKECTKSGLLVNILIGGEGSELERLKKIKFRDRLDNVKFLGGLSKKEVRDVLSVSDATYTSFLNKPVLGTGSPNKFFDSLAAGKLSIVNSKGWLKDIVESEKCGFYADPNSPKELVELFQKYMDKDQLILAQKNARKLAEIQFSKVEKVKELVSLLES